MQARRETAAVEAVRAAADAAIKIAHSKAAGASRSDAAAAARRATGDRLLAMMDQLPRAGDVEEVRPQSGAASPSQLAEGAPGWQATPAPYVLPLRVPEEAAQMQSASLAATTTAAHVPALVAALRGAVGGPEQCAAAVALAAALGEEGDAAEALAESGAVEALVWALEGSEAGDAPFEPLCTALSAVVDALPAAAQGALLALPALARGLQAGSAGAAGALGSLCCVPGELGALGREAAHRAGVLKPLVRTLSRGAPGAAAAAAAAALSCCVTEHPASCAALLRLGALPHLLALLPADDEGGFSAARCLHAGCAGGPAWALACVDARAPACLARTAADARAHLLVRLECLKALAALCCALAQGEEAAEAAAVAALLSPGALAQLIRGGPANRDFWREAALACAALLPHCDGDWAGGAGGAEAAAALSQLLAASVGGGGEGEEAGPDAEAEADVEVEVDVLLGGAALGALADGRLLRCAHSCAQFDAAPGAFSAALTLMQLPPTSAVPAHACSLLRARFSHGETPGAPLAQATAPLLVQALARAAGAEETTAAAAGCCAALAGGAAGCEALRSAGALPRLVALLGDGPHAPTAHAAAHALHALSIAGSARCRRALEAVAGLHALLSLCSEAPGSGAAAHAACALAAAEQGALEVEEGAAAALQAVAQAQPRGSPAALAADAALQSLLGNAAAPTPPPSHSTLGLLPLRPPARVPSSGSLRPEPSAALSARLEALQLGGAASLFAQDPRAAEAAAQQGQAAIAADAHSRRVREAQALEALQQAETAEAEAAILEAHARSEWEAAERAARVAADIEGRAWAGVADAEGVLAALEEGPGGSARALAQARLAAAHAKAEAAASAAAVAARRAAVLRSRGEEAWAQLCERVDDAERAARAVPKAAARRESEGARVYHRAPPGRAEYALGRQ